MITFPVYKLIEYYRGLYDPSEYNYDHNLGLIRALNFIRSDNLRVHLHGREINNRFYFTSGVNAYKYSKYRYTVVLKVDEDEFISDGGVSAHTASSYTSYIIDVERPCYFEVPDFDAFYDSIKNFGAFIYSDKDALKLYLTL